MPPARNCATLYHRHTSRSPRMRESRILFAEGSGRTDGTRLELAEVVSIGGVGGSLAVLAERVGRHSLPGERPDRVARGGERVGVLAVADRAENKAPRPSFGQLGCRCVELE